ncbi:VOC family protein [Microlunatus speluncae]|uniref:VOC family protein n=1 Tax=Microlunatus speluncae TaxID=2594267 RepID=UPI0012666616|nr:VOC family protein [Microlunatus speluncae]
MKISSVTVGLIVSDLDAAARWYERVLERDAPDLRPVDGVIEYDLDGCWLQLCRDEVRPGHTVFRFGVPDVRAERQRLEELGLVVGELIEVPGVISYFDFEDPDRNRLSCYTEA